MSQEGLQSDARFAESYVRSRVEKGYGALRIRQELKLRGVEVEDQSVMAAWDFESLIEKVYAKKYGLSPPGSVVERASRELFLRQRGFDNDQIRHLFRRLGRDVDA